MPAQELSKKKYPKPFHVFIGFVAISFIVAFILGGIFLGK
jgi:hypothetical protein